MQKGIRRLGAGVLAVALLLSMGVGALAAGETPGELWKEDRGSVMSVGTPRLEVIGSESVLSRATSRVALTFNAYAYLGGVIENLEIIGPDGSDVLEPAHVTEGGTGEAAATIVFKPSYGRGTYTVIVTVNGQTASLSFNIVR